MNDPHVESLTYKLEPDASVTFDRAPPLEWDTPACFLKLADQMLRVAMKEHFAVEREARERVEPVLRSWEIHTALRYGASEIHFAFVAAELIDRKPSPRDGLHILVVEPANLNVTVNVQLHVRRVAYPDPPVRFLASPDVATMWQRYEGYLQKREPLAGMAFFCLSFLQNESGGRKEASAKYAVDRAVLDKLGELSSERGDMTEARKVDRRATFTPLSNSEKNWIQEAVKALIRRKGEYDFDPTGRLPVLALGDLPKL